MARDYGRQTLRSSDAATGSNVEPLNWLESLRRSLKAAIRGIDAHIPFVVAPHTSPNRHTVSDQLRKREAFPAAEWKSCGFDPVAVRGVLSVISREFAWPNDHFLPSDPVNLVLLGDKDDVPFAWLADSLESLLQKRYSQDGLFSLYEESETVADFVGGILGDATKKRR